jgi:hypothetical protein
MLQSRGKSLEAAEVRAKDERVLKDEESMTKDSSEAESSINSCHLFASCGKGVSITMLDRHEVTTDLRSGLGEIWQ